MSLYDDLEVKRDASPSEIKSAYRRLAKRHHPDKGGDVKQFQIVQHAYDILSDSSRRKQYDETGAEAAELSLDKFAKQQFMALVLQAVEQAPSVDHDDLCAFVTNVINQGIPKADQEVQKIERKLSRLESARKRFKRRKKREGLDLVEAVIAQQITAAQGALVAAKRNRELGDKLLEMIKEYSYKTDPKPKVEPPRYTTTYFFGSSR